MYLEVGVQAGAKLVVEGNEALIPSAESNLVAAIVPPVIKGGALNGVPEANHIGDLSPTVLTNPAIGAGAIGVESRADSVSRTIGGRTSISVFKGKAGHDPGVSIGVGQIESGCHLVVLSLLVS